MENYVNKNRQVSLILNIVIILCFVISFGFILHRAPHAPDASTTSLQGVLNSSLPARLKILSINVDAPIESVGLTPLGAMDVPKGPALVAWYKLGPRPGEIGNAVVAGHSGWKNNKPAVFDNLHKLQKGDLIYIQDAKGNTITFVMRESRSYDPKADATDVFSSNDGKAHLNLITCEGVWDKVTQSRSKRLVVFADRVY